VPEPHALARDLDEILERNRDDFAALRGARLFVTGGTGFVGTWLVESFAWANRRLALGARAELLVRDVARFATAAPHLAADAAISTVAGDVRTFAAPADRYDAILHLATPASAAVNDEEPLVMIDTVVGGMRRVLDLAAASGRVPVLFTSSGAVYGRQPPELVLVAETDRGGPDPLDARFAYHEAKRLAEQLCAVYAKTRAVAPKIARLFAFVGPHLPLDRHFAVGNFVRDALAGGPIVVGGDGTPVRTYLYAGDMTSWLWRILVRGEPLRAYNVGSCEPMSIAQTARRVAGAAASEPEVIVRGTPVANRPAERYACATDRARTELELAEWTPFDESIRRTLAWAARSR